MSATVNDFLEYPPEMKIVLLNDSNPFLDEMEGQLPVIEILGITPNEIKNKNGDTELILVARFNQKQQGEEVVRELFNIFLSGYSPDGMGKMDLYTSKEIVDIVTRQADVRISLTEIYQVMKTKGYSLAHNADKGMVWQMFGTDDVDGEL